MNKLYRHKKKCQNNKITKPLNKMKMKNIKVKTNLKY